jgi:vitamin B12 transporter
MRLTLFGAAVAASVAGASLATHAQPTGAAAIEEVKVVARRLEETLPQELERTGSRVTTVTSADIAKGVFNDVSQTLQYNVPGLYVAPNSGQFSYVEASLQGSRNSDILWLVDGVRMNNRLYSTTMPLDSIPAHMVERIEVLEGGQGLFYGSQAVAGVVNIVTKEFTNRFDSEVSAGLDTNSAYNVAGFMRGPIGGSHFVLYGSIDQANEGIQPFRDQDYQPSATDRDRGFDVKTAGVKALHDFSDDVRLSFMYQHTDADVELLTPALVASNVNSRDEEVVAAKLDYRINERVDLFVKGYWHDWDTLYTTRYNSLENPGEIEVIYDNAFWGFEDYGVNALVRFKGVRGLEYSVGYDLQKYGGQDDVLLIAKNKEQTQSYFGQVRTSDDFSKKLHLSLGLRYNSPSDAESATVWTGSGRYDITENLFVRGVVGTSFRLPSAEELYAIDPFERGNPNLVPEKAKNLNLSIGGRRSVGSGGFSWELIGFARDVTHLIDFIFDEDLGLDQAANVPGKVKVRGGELALRAQFTAAVSSRLSLTRTSSERNGAQIQRIPERLIQAGLEYAPPSNRFGVNVSANHVGDVFVRNFSGAVEYGNYTLLDVASWYYVDDARHHRVSVRLENAFDEEYGRPGTGFTDADESPYTIVNLGTPRTWHLNYTYAF